MDKTLPAYCGGCIKRIAPEDAHLCRVVEHGGWGCLVCPVCSNVFNEGCPVHVPKPFEWSPAIERGENVNPKLFALA